MASPRELVVRRARMGGRPVAVLRAFDTGGAYVVEAEVFPRGFAPGDPVRPGPYTFATESEAREFLEETTQALMYLGCEVQ